MFDRYGIAVVVVLVLAAGGAIYVVASNKKESEPDVISDGSITVLPPPQPSETKVNKDGKTILAEAQEKARKTLGERIHDRRQNRQNKRIGKEIDKYLEIQNSSF